MAGRFVILEFDDRNTALEVATDEVTLEAWNCKVMGVYIRPDVFCECPTRKREDIANWVKGKRTGIHLCANCHRPSRHLMAGLRGRIEYLFGYNQLKDN